MDLLDQLLEKTSRTFALAIPLLPEPTRRQVTLAYLLLRVADTLEDGMNLSKSKRVEFLAELSELLVHPNVDHAQSISDRWVYANPIDNPHYIELLGEFPHVLQCILDLDVDAKQVILQHSSRTAEGMEQYVRNADDSGSLRLTTMRQLKHYCYVVAGIVGELLTDLFLLADNRLHQISTRLKELSPAFGEGLQLVNILRDADCDQQSGRYFLPTEVDRALLFQEANRDLAAAEQYIELLKSQNAHKGIVAFTQLPVALAQGTLQRVWELGPGSKLTRAEVGMVLDRVQFDAVGSE